MNIHQHEIDELIKQYRDRLLAYVDGFVPRSPEDIGPLEFVNEVVTHWFSVYGGRELPPAKPSETTFWFVLRSLKDAVEYRGDQDSDRYEGQMLLNILNVKECLRKGEGPPEGYRGGRPGVNDLL